MVHTVYLAKTGFHEPVPSEVLVPIGKGTEKGKDGREAERAILAESGPPAVGKRPRKVLADALPASGTSWRALNLTLSFTAAQLGSYLTDDLVRRQNVLATLVRSCRQGGYPGHRNKNSIPAFAGMSGER
jgi:hypothetical protein